MAVLSRWQKVSIFGAILVLSWLWIYFSGNSQIAGLRSSAILWTNNSMVTAVDDIMRSYSESKETLDEEWARKIYQQLEAMKSTLRLSSNSYAGALHGNNRNIAQMQQVITKMENEKSSNSQEISRLTTEINKKTSEITRMEAKRKADLKSCLATAKREKKGKDKCTTSSSRTTAVITGLRWQIAPLQTSITTINTRATSVVETITKTTLSIAQITRGNEQLQSANDAAQRANNAISKAQDDIQTKFPQSNEEKKEGEESGNLCGNFVIDRGEECDNGGIGDIICNPQCQLVATEVSDTTTTTKGKEWKCSNKLYECDEGTPANECFDKEAGAATWDCAPQSCSKFISPWEQMRVNLKLSFINIENDDDDPSAGRSSGPGFCTSFVF